MNFVDLNINEGAPRVYKPRLFFEAANPHWTEMYSGAIGNLVLRGEKQGRISPRHDQGGNRDMPVTAVRS